MWNVEVRTKALGPGGPGRWWLMSASLLGFCTNIAHAAPPTHIDPDPVPRQNKPAPVLPPSWDLDGLYIWLGPSGAATYVDTEWDSTIGGDLSVMMQTPVSASPLITDH